MDINSEPSISRQIAHAAAEPTFKPPIFICVSGHVQEGQEWVVGGIKMRIWSVRLQLVQDSGFEPPPPPPPCGQSPHPCTGSPVIDAVTLVL